MNDFETIVSPLPGAENCQVILHIVEGRKGNKFYGAFFVMFMS